MAPTIPFSEPPYLSGLPSPYYSSSHLAWQRACRAFIEENLYRHAMDWEREETVPPHVFHTFAAANMLVPSLPSPLPVKWLKELGIHDILGVVKVENWDYVHTAIYADEVNCAITRPWHSPRNNTLMFQIIDGAIWTGRPLRVSDHRNGIWRSSVAQIWQ